MRLSSHAGAGPRHMPSHAGGGAWPGGVGGEPPGLTGGVLSLFGDGTYSGNVVQGGSVLSPENGVLTVSGAATVVPDLETFACVVLCDWLVVDGAGASLGPTTNNSGLLIFARSGIQCINGGRIHNDKLGKAGNFGSLTAYDLAPASIKSRLSRSALNAFVISGEGAAGAPGVYGIDAPGTAGSAATAMQSGGGGSGTTNSSGGYNTGCGGGKGGPCVGGGGGGGFTGDAGQGGVDAAPYGPGGVAVSYRGFPAAGGPGDPVGAGAGTTIINGVGAGGGLLMLFTPSMAIASGCVVSADGAAGSNANSYGAGMASGGAGGGVVCLVTCPGGYANNGTVRASGGAGGLGWYNNAGAGGAGSVNLFTV